MDFCLSYLDDKILKGFDKYIMIGMILIDLQKAFDTTDHDVILQKLYTIGFLKHTVYWLKSHLSDRSFLVNLENSFLNLHLRPVLYPKVLFGDQSCFQYV